MRKKDKLWEYVEKLDGNRFKCKFCDRNFPGGITRVKSHFAGVQGRDIEVCSKVSEDVQAEAFLAINGGNKKTKTISSEGNQEGSQTMSSTSLRGMNQSTMPEFSREKKKMWTNFLLSISY